MGKNRTAGEAGWHESRYNLKTDVPGTDKVAIVNLFKGNCAEYTLLEMYLLSVLEELDENHPIIERFAKRGIICNFNEYAALETMGRASCVGGMQTIILTICPTMGCNFDCPYCFEKHTAGKMSPEVQNDVEALARRMLDAAGSGNIDVVWFGGEPLLACDIIESLSARLIKLTEERGGLYRARIITNGYLLTQDIADMLGRCKVDKAQITLDGIGPVHDATRHLAGGEGTYERIVSNLRNIRLPFQVDLRHNVHDGNLEEVGRLKKLISKISEESNNRISYYPSPVFENDTADFRGSQVKILNQCDASDICVLQEKERFRAGRGNYCGAQSFWNIGIDEKGNLHKCWEAIDKETLAFGTAHDWDPKDPLATAAKPDNLTSFLNTAIPVPDDKCKECVWLPMCAGGCPYQRLFRTHRCIPFKDHPENYVLALHADIGKKNKLYEKQEDTTRNLV